MKHFIISIFIVFLNSSLHLNADSLRVFTFREYYSAVKQYHPISIQAGLKVKQGEANVLKSRGSFDPLIRSDFNSKVYNGLNYFQYLNADITIPTWYGLEFKSGYYRNSGMNLGPEDKLPDAGILYSGFGWNIGKGLITDQRRTALSQAKVFKDLSYNEQNKILNNLLFEAGKVWWEWWTSYQILTINKEALEIAEVRFESVKQSALLGDRPFVDTLEAGIQVQERKINLKHAEQEYTNKTLSLSVYLWTDSEQPYLLPEFVVPPGMNDIAIESEEMETLVFDVDSVLKSHPEIRTYTFQLQSLNYEKEWKMEQLKPNVKLHYYPLFEYGQNTFDNRFSDRYKFGLSFSIPVLLRKERGELQSTKIAIREMELEQKNKVLELNTKTRTYLNEFYTSLEQLRIYNTTVLEYYSLLDAERNMFNLGESSIFMINARELSYIQAKIKQIELVLKKKKAFLSAIWSSGQMHLNVP